MIHITTTDPSLDLATAQPADLTLDKPGDYLAGYQRIVQAIHGEQDLRVLVRDRVVSKWLLVLARRYGPQLVTITELTLRRRLREQIGSEIPEQVTDQQIRESGLLDISIPARSGATFEEHLLEVFFGNILTLPGGLRRINELIASYEPEQWQSALKRPLVKQAFEKRVRELRSQLMKEGRTGELQLLDWLSASPALLIRNLFALKILSGYGEALGKRVLGDVYPYLVKLNLDLRKTPAVFAGNEQAVDEIALHIEELLSAPSESALEVLLTEVSGYLEAEFDAVLRLLRTGTATVTRDLVGRIQSKFQPIADSPRMGQALSDLDLLISRKRPSSPEKAWGEGDWMHWATDEYLPYRFWQENTGQIDDEIVEFASQYADWLHSNFGKLRYHSPNMAWKAMLGLKDEIKAHSGPVLVIVADNLNAKFHPDLQAQMQRQGYYEHSLAYCFSMLPSCTEVSKKCVITGHYVPFEGSSYKKPVEETWAGRFGKRVLYLSGIGDLRAVASREHDVYFLNYLPVDITLHQSENATGVSHAQAIRGYLASLAQDVRAFAKRLGAERDLLVVVVSDHGSTRIPKGAANVLQGKFYHERAIDEHHRYLSLADQELAKLSANVRYDCYVLKRQDFELDANYLVARKLYRFRETDETAYIHGGLTPEETLTPLAIYRPITLSPKPLQLSQAGTPKIYLGTKFTLSLEITNLNSYPCDQVIIEIADPNIQAEPMQLGGLPQLKREPIKMTAQCRRTADVTAKKLHVRIVYRFLGQPWVDETDIPVQIVDPAATKFALDNL